MKQFYYLNRIAIIASLLQQLTLHQQLTEAQQQLVEAQKQIISLQKQLDKMIPKTRRMKMYSGICIRGA